MPLEHSLTRARLQIPDCDLSSSNISQPFISARQGSTCALPGTPRMDWLGHHGNHQIAPKSRFEALRQTNLSAPDRRPCDDRRPSGDRHPSDGRRTSATRQALIPVSLFAVILLCFFLLPLLLALLLLLCYSWSSCCCCWSCSCSCCWWCCCSCYSRWCSNC